MAAGTLLLAVAMVAPVAPAQAANPSAGFQPGNIISDANFYDGNAMSVAEVQAFLNKQVPSCWLGRPGYEVGKPVQWGGPTKLASKCLKDFRINTTTQTANAYCAAIPGIANETAASVIVRVAKACGISAKVLLVMLDKEQSLVSDPWPNENQYFLAMGYACPDSGPGNSANCDPSKGGFAKQVYRAAWQFKVYKAFPDSYRYKPFQTATVQWHPNVGCGTSQVKIENYATAGLYIYTPYRPNQAALNAGWGTGDACSTYGNRNFYNFYKAWFGNPVGVSVDAKLQTAYGSAGGASGRLGQPAGKASVYANGAVGQGFEGGSIYWSGATGAQIVYTTPIRDFYWANGSWTGALGFPSGRENQYRDGGVGQGFQGGSVYVGPKTGPAVVRGQIRDEFWRLGSISGELGYPTGKESSYRDGGRGQGFEKGSIYWSAQTGARSVSGRVRDAFWKNGSISGALGYPLGSQNLYLSGGVGQAFSGGSIYGRNGQEAFAISGKMLTRYWGQKSTTGVLRYPTGPMLSYRNGGFGQPFEGGSLYQSATGDAWEVTGPILWRYWQIQSGAGVVGYPIEAPISLGIDQAVQRFERGVIFQEDREAAWEVYGRVLEAYDSVGAQKGQLGFPVGPQTSSAGGIVQQFRNGSIEIDADGKSLIKLTAARSASEATPKPLELGEADLEQETITEPDSGSDEGSQLDGGSGGPERTPSPEIGE